MKKLINVKTFLSVGCLVLALTGGLQSSVAGSQVQWNVMDYGTQADGKVDDGPAIQKAMNAAHEAGGGEVIMPAGTYRIEDHVVVPSGVTLSGIWETPHHEDQVWGTVIHAVGYRGKEDGPALVQLSPSSAIKGLTIYWPEQTSTDVVPYPWAIQGRGMHGTVMNLTLVNAYQGIDFGSYSHELHIIKNVFGCVLRRGVYINKCTDIGRIENVHFNPHYWGRANVPTDKKPTMGDLINYLNSTTEVFIFGRTDWEYVFNTFAFGFDKCYKFVKTESGACNGNFLGIGADGGRCALWIEDTQPAGLLITNGEFVTFNGDNPTQIITTETFKGVVQLNNCSFWGPAYRNMLMQGDGYVSLNQCNFDNWGKGSPEHSLHIEGGTIHLSGNRFVRNKPHIFIGEGVSSGVVLGNHFKQSINITNEAGDKIQMGFNSVMK